MFNNRKDTAPTTPAASLPAQQKRSGRATAPSIISSDLVVTGSLSSTGDIQIDGRVDGDVQSASLVIGDKAFVQGEIVAEDVVIRGRVEGAIRARKVQLCATSHVEGNIMHESFAVETGAFFDGNCRHHDNPLSEEASASRMPAVEFAKTPSIQMVRTSEPPRPAASVAPLKSGA
ncbi:MAG TPA: polymer-forming cytoskeletal protein [Rhizomicrobium sp.]|jgi:cytoskeletal protein CcmA (bactofilin family)